MFDHTRHCSALTCMSGGGGRFPTCTTLWDSIFPVYNLNYSRSAGGFHKQVQRRGRAKGGGIVRLGSTIPGPRHCHCCHRTSNLSRGRHDDQARVCHGPLCRHCVCARVIRHNVTVCVWYGHQAGRTDREQDGGHHKVSQEHETAEEGGVFSGEKRIHFTSHRLHAYSAQN